MKSKKLILSIVMSAMLVIPTLPTKADVVDENDLYILSHLICGEAEGCSKAMKESVGSVVLNRVDDARFPDTIYEVVFQEGQYSCTWDGNYYRDPSTDTIDIAKDLLENGSKLDKSVVWQAEFVQGIGIYDVIGNMYFCY